ncbi:MAG: hypothetical protein GAK43_01363 [Stenotrophomonas maltophilia]|nr:MAG: hypothetical protein GAK43_01363 [Stenotrophomonas maltophilia]
MRAILALLRTTILLLITGLLLGGWWLLPDQRLRPVGLGGSTEDSSLRLQGLRRDYLLYVPAHLAPKPPLLIVLHGLRSNGEGMRRLSGYGFDALADRDGFLVLYPDGYDGHWNDCRRQAPYTARARQIDDVAYLTQLIQRLRRERQVDPQRVFVVGYSNGGHMALRLAAEAVQPPTAIALVAASLPAVENDVCQRNERALPALLMAGTRDPINPYTGGEVSFFGLQSRGQVLSATDSALALARRNRLSGEAQRENLTAPGPIWTQAQRWSAPGHPPVELVTVQGGGHVLSQPVYRAPRLLGEADPQLDGPGLIWRFFEEAVPPTAVPVAEPPPTTTDEASEMDEPPMPDAEPVPTDR